MVFRDIFEQHKDMVYNLALNYVQNQEDAEEITQDVFVKVYQGQESFDHRSQLKTWIYKITMHQCLDFIKSKQRHKRSIFHQIIRVDDIQNGQMLAHFDHPGIALEQKEDMQKLFSVINQLPEQQKTVILLLKTEQLSQTETADIMNISAKAVDSLFQRAKKNLSELLNKSKDTQ